MLGEPVGVNFISAFNFPQVNKSLVISHLENFYHYHQTAIYSLGTSVSW